VIFNLEFVKVRAMTGGQIRVPFGFHSIFFKHST